MACPRCDWRMAPGRLRVRGTFLGFLFYGISWQHLWWTDANDSRESRLKLIGSGGQRHGLRCASCGMIAFMP